MASMKIKLAAVRALENNRGRVTPEALVRASKKSTHPLHKEFLWGKEHIAAHKWRIEFAREIIASVRVSTTRADQTISTIGYIRDPEAKPNMQGYVSMPRLRTEQENAEEALLVEVARVQSCLERAREIAAFLELEPEFEAALLSALELTARMRRGPALRRVETSRLAL